jgi:hypothetical protein
MFPDAIVPSPVVLPASARPVPQVIMHQVLMHKQARNDGTVLVSRYAATIAGG